MKKASPVDQVASISPGLLVESVRDYAIFALDRDGRVMSWNVGAQRIKGYSSDEIIGESHARFYLPEDAKAGRPRMLLDTALRDGRVEDEGWRLRKDGSRFWADVVITALFDEDGQHVGFAKVTRDLSERRAAEDALRASEERFRLLVQSVKDYGIFMLDPTGHIASWNEGAERIKGYTYDEIIGKHFSIFYPPEDLERDKPAMELRVAARVGRFEDEGWRVRQDGTLFWANVVITALRTADNTLIGFAKVTRDLTERRAAEQRAISDARKIAEVESANRAKNEFLATMSHELRTPLNAIGGYTELIEMGVGGAISGRQRDYLERIRIAQQHLLALINDLLNYNKIESGKISYDLGPVQVSSVVNRVLTLLSAQAAARDIELNALPCDEELIAFADRTKVEQIVVNLVSNAVKFTPPGGFINVACSARAKRVFITVADSGPGIPPDKQDAIFEPFVQLGRSLTQIQEGTGLGLSISRDLARAMDGDVTVASGAEGGATFTVTLPRA
ncbi:MAG TPA: PAS domain-containing sensor histidine kinase [Gemmatimonadaceae bacterium]|nr:PAS domain-containing sensor histidine kinase [Gemmatimonadaceae bacterium]